MPKHIDSAKEAKFETICQAHRDIYQLLLKRGLTEEDEEIKLLKTAYGFGKKMNYKLRQYKFDYDNDWYELHKKDGPEIDEEEKSEA